MKKLFLVFWVSSLLYGCASTLPVSELKQGVKTVAFVQNGTAPLSYSTGVIDTSSFWANYGGGMNGLAFDAIAAGAQSRELSKAEQNALMVKSLYGDSDLAPVVYREIMPKLAGAWGQNFDPAELVVLDEKPASVVDEKLQNFKSSADLVLMLEVYNINLTERFSMGGAFAAGFTMGANTKSLTTEASVIMRAFKPSVSDPGTYEQAWIRGCGPNYTTMKTSYTLDELKEKPERMQEILNEAKAQAVEGCAMVLASVN